MEMNFADKNKSIKHCNIALNKTQGCRNAQCQKKLNDERFHFFPFFYRTGVTGGDFPPMQNMTKNCSLFEQDTSLADLLQLNLHCFEEEVRGIVDRAVKEMGMEKVLSELNSTWAGG